MLPGCIKIGLNVMAAAARRISALASASEPAVASAAKRSSDDDVVVVSALRTAICKAKRGAFKDTSPDVLLSTVMKAVLDGSGFPAEELGDICVGRGDNKGTAPSYTPPACALRTRRQCSSARWRGDHGSYCPVFGGYPRVRSFELGESAVQLRLAGCDECGGVNSGRNLPRWAGLWG